MYTTDIQGMLLTATAYLIGSIPTAYIIGRWRKGIDLRTFGSRTLGASNTWTTTGKKEGIAVAIVDVLIKGAMPVAFARLINLPDIYLVITGLSAVVGHNWSIFLKFAGGRGLSIFAGSLLAIWAPAEILFLLSFFLLGLFLKKAAVLSILGLFTVPVLALTLNETNEIFLLCTGFLILTVIKRLAPNKDASKRDRPILAILRNRLLYDRDVTLNEEWTHRHPPDVS